MPNYILYMKTHKITGLKYLGKTKNGDPYKYNGSGTKWVKHYKKHGPEHIETEILFQSENLLEFSKKCLEISKELNVVESSEFANMKLEDGMDGGALPGEDHPLYGRKRPRQSILMTGESNPAKRQEHRDNHHTKKKEWREAQAKRWEEDNPMFREDVRKKVSEKLKGPRQNMQGRKKPKLKCDVCGFLAAAHLIDRWHNNNCKGKNNE